VKTALLKNKNKIKKNKKCTYSIIVLLIYMAAAVDCQLITGGRI
jgi:hypothetical protein